MLLPIHIAAGGLAIVLGAVALSVKKGGTIHRRSGLLFVYAMLVMGVSASILSLLNGPRLRECLRRRADGVFRRHRAHHCPPGIVLDAPNQRRCADGRGRTRCRLRCRRSEVDQYARPRREWRPVPDRGRDVVDHRRRVDRWRRPATCASCASALPRGGPRLARHLWRMCFALFIAAGSFFSIRERVAQILPEPFTTGPMRALPIVLLFGAMFYWLWRVRGRRTLPVLVRHDSARRIWRELTSRIPPCVEHEFGLLSSAPPRGHARADA